jgi:hypothetical protein
VGRPLVWKTLCRWFPLETCLRRSRSLPSALSWELDLRTVHRDWKRQRWGSPLFRLKPAVQSQSQEDRKATMRVERLSKSGLLCCERGSVLLFARNACAIQEALLIEVDITRAQAAVPFASARARLVEGSLSIPISHRYCTFGQKSGTQRPDLNKRRPLGCLCLTQSNEALASYEDRCHGPIGLK